MSPTGSCIGSLLPDGGTVWEAVERLGDWALLENVSHQVASL